MARPLSKSLLLWTRTLHIYLTMLGLVLLIFFAFTGFVLNHPDWFSIDDVTATDKTAAKNMPLDIAGGKGEGSSEHALKIEVYLRMHEGAQGERTSFDDQEDTIRVDFTGPGRKMEYHIAKADGVIEEHFEIRNAIALMSDLHRGKGSGNSWRLFIDATAIFLLFASVSGVILWLALPKRRTLGIIALAASLLLCGGCWWFLLP